MIRKDVKKRVSRQKVLVASLMLSIAITMQAPFSVLADTIGAASDNQTTVSSSSGREGGNSGVPGSTVPEVTPTVTPEPTPTPEVTPTPEPTPEATPTPAVTPEATPMPVPPTPVPEPTPDTQTQTPVDNSDQTPIDLDITSYATPVLFHTIPKDYALSKVETFVNIREDKDDGSRIVGTMNHGSICYIIADKDQEWIYVESGDARGFVKREYLMMDEDASMQVEAIGEDKFTLAECLIPSEENAAYTYSMDTVKDVNTSSELRNSLLQFSQQFLGNPYVWGGTSLTEGCDCSGYVMQIYREYGYTLPRTSEEQSQCGIKIPAAEARPGDLLFYQKNGKIYHVLIYMGDGKAINAQSTNTGIVISDVDYSKVPWAVRVIDDVNDTLSIRINNGGIEPNGQYLGRFKLTAYCNCPQCCGKWSGGPTASGTMPTQGVTVAMGGMEFGTKLNIGGQVFTLEDRGTPYGHIDIYMNSHEECNNFGVQYADVYIQN